MQIREIILYSNHGETNSVPFRIGKMNVIKGTPSSGKSALSDIVEYCIGREACMVPSGELRELVSWYGILFQLKNNRIFVARKVPEGSDTRSSLCYYKEGIDLESPSKIEESNISFDHLIEKLSEVLGIQKNLTLTISSVYDIPQKVTIKNAVYYSFQPQDEIGVRGMLFHRQSDKMRPTLISRTLPYFLGAIPEDYVQLEFRLNKERKERFRLIQDLKELDDIRMEGINKAKELFNKAIFLGLITEEKQIENLENYRSHFREALSWKPNEIILPHDTELPLLRRKARELEQKLSSIEESIHETLDYDKDVQGYLDEINHQQLRLESINLFDPKSDGSKCPLCSNIIADNVDHVEEIDKALMQLSKELKNTAKEKPEIEKFIQNLESEKQEKKLELTEILKKIKFKLEQESESSRLRDLDLERSNLQGRIQFWLDSVKLSDPKSDLRNAIEEIDKVISEIGIRINEQGIKNDQRKILSEISSQISTWAKKLRLGYSELPIFLDIDQPTLLFNKDGSYQPFQTIGGGQNWLSYHVLMHLALHKYFREHDRPIPSFIFLDQPSSSHNPQAIGEFYGLIKEVIDKLYPKMQVIITEQLEFDNPVIADSVIDTWTDDKKLVPKKWKK